MPLFPRVGDLFGRYRIDAQIGHGGMGVVFGATDTAFDRRVALKVVSASLGGSSEFLARFEREAALLARLNSPHVIAIFDYGEQDGCPYIATQYVGGGDLGALLAARGPMPPSLALTVCAQVADALADAHRAGVVHRDVKPSNVLLRDADTLDLHAYLCDFGIARTDGEGLTAPGSVSGTWSYLAPECGTGAPGTVASDLYALGCLLWATLTGQSPFVGTDVEIAIAHQRAPVPQLAGEDPFTRHVNAILSNTLAKDPRERYDDADTLRADLLSAASLPASGVRPLRARRTGSPAAVPPTAGASPGRLSLGSLPPGSPPRTGRRRPRRTALVVALSSFAVLAVAGGIVAVTTLGGDDPGPGPRGGGTSSSSPTAAGPSTATTPTEPPAPEVVGPVTGDQDGDGLGDLTGQILEEGPGKSRQLTTTWSSDGSRLTVAGERREAATPQVSEYAVLGDLDGDDLLEEIRVDAPSGDRALMVGVDLADGSRVSQSLDRLGGAEYVTPFSGDADGDGRDDLLLLSWSRTEPMELWTARWTGSQFARPRRGVTLPVGFDFSSVETGDLDGDGRADLALITTPDAPALAPSRSTVRTYLGQRDGSFVERGAPRVFTSDIGLEMNAADVDGDEDSELVVGLNKDSFIELLVLDHQTGGMGRPRPWGLMPVPQGRYFDTTTTVGDYDGDGLDDLATVGPAATGKRSTVQVVLSTGKQFASASRWASWDVPLRETYGPELLGATFP